jgi:hypothetical protein
MCVLAAYSRIIAIFLTQSVPSKRFKTPKHYQEFQDFHGFQALQASQAFEVFLNSDGL